MAGENISATEGLLNPAVPTVAEDTKPQKILSIAHSITQPAAPKSGEVALSGLATLLGEAVHGLDNAQKVGLDERMRRDIEQMKTQRIGELESAKESLSTPDAKGILPAPGKPLPADIKDLPKNLEWMKELRANKKMTSSEFDGKLRRYLSDLREQNPGYRDYIDDQGKKIIGYDPANAEMKQRIEDVNALLAGKKTDNDWAMKQAIEHYGAFPWVGEMYQKWSKGEDVIGYFIQHKAKPDQIKSMATLGKEQQEFDKLESEKQTDEMARQILVQGLNDMKINGFGKTRQEVMTALDNWAKNGWSEYNPEQMRQLGMRLELGIQRLKEQATAFGNMPITVTEDNMPHRTTSHIAAQGATAFNSRIDAVLAPTETLKNMLLNKEFGPAHVYARIISDVHDKRMSELLSDPDIATVEAGFKISKEFGDEMLRIYTADPKRSSKLRDLFTVVAAKAGTGAPDASLLDEVDRLIKAGYTEGTTYHSLFRMIEGVATNPEVDKKTRTNVFNFFTNPKNQGLMDKLQVDSTVTTADGTKVRVPAVYNGYFILTSPDMTKAVGQTDTTAQQNYRNRSGEWLGRLFTTDVKNINLNISRFGPIAYDGESHQFKQYSTAGVSDPSQLVQLGVANGTINRLNLALRNYTGVLDATGGGDVNHEIATVLETMGFNPKGENSIKQMYDAVVRTIMAPRKTNTTPGMSEPK